MHLRSHYWIPGIIFLASLCLHLSLISKGPVTVDCLNLAVQSQGTLETHQLHHLPGSGYPLMVLLGSIFISIGKWIGMTDHILAVNLISVLFSSIAILVFYFLIQEICDTLIATLASFILLLNPIFLDVSTYGINHAPALCFLLLGLLSLWRFQTAGNTSNLWLSALYFGLMGATRLQDFVLTSPAICFMFIVGLKPGPSKNTDKIRCFIVWITIIFLIILFFHLPYLTSTHPAYGIQAKDYWRNGLTDSFQKLFSLAFINSVLYLVKTFSIVGIVCFGAGLYYTAVLNKRLLIFTVLWWAVPLSLFGHIITNSPRYFTILIPALIIPISTLLAHLLRHQRILCRLIALISLLIIIFRPLLDTQETLIRRHQHALISDFYHWVGKSTESNATIISSDDNLFVAYYSRRHILEKPVPVGHLPPAELIGFKKEVDRILNEQKPVYITDFGLMAYDYYFEFRNFMKRNYRLITIGQMPSEIWYETPYKTDLRMYRLIKIEKMD